MKRLHELETLFVFDSRQIIALIIIFINIKVDWIFK